MKLIFTIDFNSDYHTGAGHGLGSQIDSALLRDSDGVPCLRGTVIEGLLRNNMEELLELKPLQKVTSCIKTDNCTPQQEPCLMCRVLGSTSFPKRWFIRSARPREIDELVSSGWQVGHTASEIVWQNRVNPRTGQVEEHKLFSREKGTADLVFVFEVECQSSYPEMIHDASFLVAAARMTRSIGSGKRRGAGDCRIHLAKVEGRPDNDLAFNKEGEFLNYFGEFISGEKEAIVLPSSINSLDLSKLIDNNEKQVRFRVLLRTEEPLVLAERMDAGNISGGLDCIPGGVLLGALASRAASKYDLTDETSYGEFISVFKRGNVAYSMLYPADKRDYTVFPSIPGPLDLLTCKTLNWESDANRQNHGVVAVADKDFVPSCCDKCSVHYKKYNSEKETPLKQLTGFISLAHSRKIVKPQMRQEMHVSIDRQRNRAVTGELFGYTALESGQYFMGEIVCKSERDWDVLCELAGIVEKEVLNLYLGKGTRKGYGKVSIVLQRQDPHKPLLFIGKSINERVVAVNEPLVMTFLSDTVLTDSWGRFCQGITEDFLAEILNTASKTNASATNDRNAKNGQDYSANNMPLLNAADIEKKQEFSKAGVVYGFNNYLGLPRWQDPVIKAGTSVGFVIKKPVELEALLCRLSWLELNGIGLRKEEGFGWIAFNHPVRNMGVYINGIQIDKRLRNSRSGADSAVPYNKTIEAGYYVCGEKLLSGDDLYFIKENFEDNRWIAVSRWLTVNSLRNLDELIEILEKEDHIGSHKFLFEITLFSNTKKNFFDSACDKNKKISRQKQFLIDKLKKIQTVAIEKKLPDQFQRLAVENLAGEICRVCRLENKEG